MKKIFFVFALLLPILLSVTADAKIRIVTTIPDLAALAQEVGQDLVAIDSIARGDQDPHYIEPKPSFALKLNQADLLIDVGLELESGWLPILLTQSRNPKIQPGNPGYLSASQGLRILEIPTGKIDRSQGDVHPDGNPHYWMNPENGLVIAKGIAERLAQIDSTHADQYRTNAIAFEARLRSKIAGWKKQTTSLRGKKIITHHKSFSYFVEWTGMDAVDQVEPKPGIPPTPSHILHLVNLITSQSIPLIITENYYDPKPSQELAARTGAKVLILPTSVGGEAGIKTYEDLLDVLIRKLGGNL